MINSLLLATAIEANTVKLEAGEVSLKDFLLELKTEYESPSGKEIHLIWDYPGELPNIETDGPKLKQILQNIINNAIKFTERGAVTTSVRYFPDAKKVEFTVVDTGIGIAKDATPHIFERFQQVDNSLTRSFEGVGLGLYVVKEFAGLLGGKVIVESEPTKGSIFRITIPSEITSSIER